MFIRVKALPGQSASEIREELADGTLKVAVAAPREKGKANRELINFLAGHYGVDRKEVRIVSGHTSEIKLIEIEK
jgi:hypothetical protein